jgi:hypothetical protein
MTIGMRFCTFSAISVAVYCRLGWHAEIMMCRAYIEALLADEAQADRIWEAWQAGDVDEGVAYIAWTLIVGVGCQRRESKSRKFVGQRSDLASDNDRRVNVRLHIGNQFGPFDKL